METNNKLSSAAMSGVYLSLITIVFSLIATVFNLNQIISVLLTIIKLSLIFYVLYILVKEYAKNFETFTYGNGFKYGFLICLFSTIICTCYQYLSATVLFKEKIMLIYEKNLAQLQNTEQSSSLIEMLYNNLGLIIVVNSIFICIFFGLIVSAIVANFTKKENIFYNQENL